MSKKSQNLYASTFQDVGNVFIWLDSEITLQHCISEVSTRYNYTSLFTIFLPVLRLGAL